MIKILFICHGNICRSPIAEFILKDMTARLGIESQFHIASAATSTEEIYNGVGNPVYPPARRELAKHGISCEGKRAVQLKKSDYDEYDYLIGMDDANIRNIERMTGHKGGKIYKLLSFAGNDASISDPWYDNSFEATYRDAVIGCEGLLEHLQKTGELTLPGGKRKKDSGRDITTVIFDLDGTLIDTEKYYRIFWPKAFEAFGLSMSDEQALAIRSLGRPFAPRQFREWYGDSVDYYAVRAKRRELMEPFLEEQGIELKPGAVELLVWLRENGYQTAVCTANDEERTRKYLEKLGLLSYFDKIICATMVKEGKPAPDVYRYACEQLCQPPECCMAVEDSPNGVLSACRAGCKVVMVPDLTQPGEDIVPLLYAKADALLQIKDLLENKRQ